jgi:hypothetical protein
MRVVGLWNTSRNGVGLCGSVPQAAVRLTHTVVGTFGMPGSRFQFDQGRMATSQAARQVWTACKERFERGAVSGCALTSTHSMTPRQRQAFPNRHGLGRPVRARRVPAID